MDETDIAPFHARIHGVEPAREDIALLGRDRRAQPHGGLRRLERHRVDGGEERGRGDHQGELGVDAAGQAGQERGRQEHRHQHQRDADDRSPEHVHGADRRVMAAHAPFDIVRRALDHHDRVIDHDADRKHDRKQRREVHAEAERPHRGERADDRHRHRGRRHQHGAPVLQEDEDDDQHQDRGRDQRLVDLADRGVDEHRGVERRRVDEPRRELARQGRHLRLDRALDIERVGARRLKDAEAGGRLAVDFEDLAVGLRSELDAADIAHPRHLAGIAGLDDHVLEFFDVGETAVNLDGVLEVDAGRRRRRADLAGGDFLALLLQRPHHVGGVEAARLQLVRIEPDAHRILAGAEDGDIADARQARKLVLEIDGRVVGEVEAVVAVVRRRSA